MLKNGSTYWLIIDGEKIKSLSFLKPCLTKHEKNQVIYNECKKLNVSQAGAKLVLAFNKYSYKINGGNL